MVEKGTENLYNQLMLNSLPISTHFLFSQLARLSLTCSFDPFSVYYALHLRLLRELALQPRRRARAKVSGELAKQLLILAVIRMGDSVKSETEDSR